jgi:hypothetical protein
MGRRLGAPALALAIAGAACVPKGAQEHTLRVTPPDAGMMMMDTSGTDTDPLGALPQGDAQLTALCGRNGTDPISKALCAMPKPKIAGIADLTKVLGLSFSDTSTKGQNGAGGNPTFALTGHSSSLVTRSVSAINPRAILFRSTGDLVVMTFTRGETFVELATKPMNGPLSFYLVRFALGCTGDASCAPGDLLTPASEKNWASWTLYEDEDLGNTIFDCLECHQPDGPNGQKMLRMQELHDPWTHFFKTDRPGGKALLDDFHAAHGTDEDYGPIPAALIDKSDPSKLSDLLVQDGYGTQPNEFLSAQIEMEVKQSNPNEPQQNTPPGMSATWTTLYMKAVMGTEIAVPYHDVKVTDPTKLMTMTSAYGAFKKGTMPAAMLPDIRNVFLDSALPEMSIRPKSTLDGRGILVHMCTSCHNMRLDQTLTRARFNMDAYDSMSRDEKDKAIRRLQLTSDKRGHMPPEMVRMLSDSELNAVVTELQK